MNVVGSTTLGMVDKNLPNLYYNIYSIYIIWSSNIIEIEFWSMNCFKAWNSGETTSEISCKTKRKVGMDGYKNN